MLTNLYCLENWVFATFLNRISSVGFELLVNFLKLPQSKHVIQIYMYTLDLIYNLRSLYKIRTCDWSKSNIWFRFNCRHLRPSSLNPNYWKYESIFFWTFTPPKVDFYQSKHSSDLAGFDTSYWHKSKFQTSLKLGICVQMQLVPVRLSLRPSRSFDFGVVSQTNGSE